MLKHHGGTVAAKNSQQDRTQKRQASAQARLADLSFSRFMREHNRQQSNRD